MSDRARKEYIVQHMGGPCPVENPAKRKWVDAACKAWNKEKSRRLGINEARAGVEKEIRKLCGCRKGVCARKQVQAHTDAAGALAGLRGEVTNPTSGT